MPAPPAAGLVVQVQQHDADPVHGAGAVSPDPVIIETPWRPCLLARTAPPSPKPPAHVTSPRQDPAVVSSTGRTGREPPSHVTTPPPPAVPVPTVRRPAPGLELCPQPRLRAIPACVAVPLGAATPRVWSGNEWRGTFAAEPSGRAGGFPMCQSRQRRHRGSTAVPLGAACSAGDSPSIKRNGRTVRYRSVNTTRNAMSARRHPRAPVRSPWPPRRRPSPEMESSRPPPTSRPHPTRRRSPTRRTVRG